MEDPRMREIIKRQRQVTTENIRKNFTEGEASDDKRKQKVEDRKKKLDRKRWEQQSECVSQDPFALPQIAPQHGIGDVLAEYGVTQHSLESDKPYNPPETKTESSISSPRSTGQSSTHKGLPPLYECAERLKARVPLINYFDSLYAFNGKCYDILSPDDVIRLYREKVDNQLSGEKSLGTISQLHRYLCTDSSIEVDEIKSNQKIAVLQNGVFDVMAGELRRHSYKEITFSFVNARYLENAKCKLFHRFLNAITGGNEVLQERLWQVLGYLLMQTTEAKVFFVMGLAPDSGKSLLGNFIESLFDERYVSNVALNDFNQKFSLAPIVGSTINISLDLPATKLKASAVSQVKMLTGGDAININQKYVPEFRYRNLAKLLFATNFPIELWEKDDAFWRRMVYLPFDYSIPKAKQNPALFEALQRERDAIVSEALHHAKTLIEHNFVFPTTQQIERQVQEWRGHASMSIENFIRDCCVLDESFRGELMGTLFSAYESYCSSTGFAAKSYVRFKDFLEDEVGLKHFKMRDGGGPQSALRGIKLKEVCYD